jgi:hypothetical protein
MVLTDPGGHGPPPIARLTEHGLEMLCRAANGSTALKNIQAGQEDFVAEKAGSKQVYYDNVDKDGMLASKVTAGKWRSFAQNDRPRVFCATWAFFKKCKSSLEVVNSQACSQDGGIPYILPDTALPLLLDGFLAWADKPPKLDWAGDGAGERAADDAGGEFWNEFWRRKLDQKWAPGVRDRLMRAVRTRADALRRVRELQAFAGAVGGDWRLGTGLLPGAAETETDSWEGACDSAGDRIRDACKPEGVKQAGGRQACGVRCGARWALAPARAPTALATPMLPARGGGGGGGGGGVGVGSMPCWCIQRARPNHVRGASWRWRCRTAMMRVYRPRITGNEYESYFIHPPTTALPLLPCMALLAPPY